MSFATLASFLIGPRSRFKVAVCRTRFDEIECFVYDAEEFSDEEIAKGDMRLFMQGTLEDCMKAIRKRCADSW